MMTEAVLHPRFLLPRLTEALADTPVVLIHGPRQCGKTTLARQVGDTAGYAYISFDDDVRCSAAVADPVGFVADLPDKAVLDEVQRVPSLFTSLKAALDHDRRPAVSSSPVQPMCCWCQNWPTHWPAGWKSYA
jgi:hypothetical protein